MLAAAWSVSPALVIVHGGGDEVSALQQAFGHVAQFVDGKRVTALDDLDLLRMALSGSANKRLVAALVGAGLPAVGISGEDAGLLRAVADQRETMGEVGTPADVNPLLLHPGIEPSADPVLLARPGAYAVSYGQRGQ